MARYTLRNQKKIAQAYDEKILKRILDSLDHAFENNRFDIEPFEDEPYEVISINDTGHTVNIILFYVIKKTYDVYNLAFKEFIG